MFLKRQPPHDVYLNDRLWSYHPAAGFDAFRETPLAAALAVDSGTDRQSEQVAAGDWQSIETAAAEADVDGQLELITLSAQGIMRWAPDTAGNWLPRSVELPETVPPTEGSLAIQDLDGDGRVDLMYTTADGWSRVNLRGPATTLHQHSGVPLQHWTLAVLDPQRGPAVLGLRADAAPLVWAPGPGRFPFAALSFTGREDGAEQMRTNASGIGIRFAVCVGGQFTASDTFRHHSGPGQSLQPIAIGMGPARRMDFVRITWPDGVFQTEMDLAGGMLHAIQETQRQISSCPVVFAWNGQQYQFTTDILGGAGIGFNTGAGEYSAPRPSEHLLLPQNLLAPTNATYRLKITEPMEEACYLDAARLVAYDLPPAWQMSLDERFATGEPLPTGEPVWYRKSVNLAGAINDRGQDVTQLVAAADLNAAMPGRSDRRFLGRTESHTITLTWDEPLDTLSGQPVLLFDGWVEYPYSQTMFAAWQAGAAYDAPTIEARGDDGCWHVVLDRFGYPAGMPREASVPLSKARLPHGTRQLRISSNMEIYWDRFTVVDAQTSPAVKRRELPLVAAAAAETGCARRTTLPHGAARTTTTSAVCRRGTPCTRRDTTRSSDRSCRWSPRPMTPWPSSDPARKSTWSLPRRWTKCRPAGTAALCWKPMAGARMPICIRRMVKRLRRCRNDPTDHSTSDDANSFTSSTTPATVREVRASKQGASPFLRPCAVSRDAVSRHAEHGA